MKYADYELMEIVFRKWYVWKICQYIFVLKGSLRKFLSTQHINHNSKITRLTKQSSRSSVHSYLTRTWDTHFITFLCTPLKHLKQRCTLLGWKISLLVIMHESTKNHFRRLFEIVNLMLKLVHFHVHIYIHFIIFGFSI